MPLPPLTFSSSIFWDLDGVLFHLSEMAKQEYLRGDYETLCERQVQADPIEHMVKLARAMSLDHNNIIVTSRSEKYRHETRRQLQKNLIPFEALYMRPIGNLEPSTILKVNIYEKFIEDFDNPKHVSLVIDDREDVINVFTAKGVPALLYKGA